MARRANDPHPVEWMEAGGVPGILSEEVGGWPLSRQLGERAGGAQPETHFSHLFGLALPHLPQEVCVAGRDKHCAPPEADAEPG